MGVGAGIFDATKVPARHVNLSIRDEREVCLDEV